MISYFSETNYELKNPENLTPWIEETILNEGHEPGEINYIFVMTNVCCKKTLNI